MRYKTNEKHLQIYGHHKILLHITKEILKITSNSSQSFIIFFFLIRKKRNETGRTY